MERFTRWRAKRHVRLKRLLAYLDEDVSRRQRDRIEKHLASCQRCRNELQLSRDLEEAARAHRPAAPPAGLLEEVLEFRASGERILLPTTAGIGPSRRRYLHHAISLLLLILAGALLLLLRTPEASAGGSTLETPAWRPSDSRVLPIEFRAISGLAAERRLRARGWYREPDDAHVRNALGAYFEAELGRAGRGRFRGEAVLPPSAVYAALVVEDYRGERLDSNGQRLWEILARDEDGRPLLAALRQQYRVAEARQTAEALDIASEMTELYPSEPEGWFYRYEQERHLSPPSVQDSLRQFHHTQVSRLRAQRSWAEASPDRLAAMTQYALALDVQDHGEWRALLERRAPSHPVAVQERVLDAVRQRWVEPQDLLRVLGEEWWRSGPATELLVQQGYQAAIRSGQATAFVVWADRYERLRPDLRGAIAVDMASFAALRRSAADVLRRQLRELETITPATRDPLRNVATERRQRASAASSYLSALGDVLLAEGRVSEALDALALADHGVWDPSLFQRLAESYLRAGDTVRAIEQWARLEADPFTHLDLSEVHEQIGQVSNERWQLAVRTAQREMRNRVLLSELFGPLPHVPAVTPAGTSMPISLSETLRGPASAIIRCTYVSFSCRRDLETLTTMLASAPHLREHVTLLFRDSAQAQQLSDFSEARVAYEHERVLLRTLEDWSTSQYFVLRGPSNQARYASYTDIPSALRALYLLLK